MQDGAGTGGMVDEKDAGSVPDARRGSSAA